MNNPFFSVIIPTYNQASFLEASLRAVFQQTFKNYEIIVIDNHSSDNTTSLVKRYKKKIIYKKINNNGIIAKSRNLGIKLAKGKWIAFLDSDDYWSKDKLKITHQLAKKYLPKVICHSEWISYPKNKKNKIWTYGPYKKNFYRLLLKHGNRLSTSATIVEKNFLRKNKILFDEQKKFITSEDYNFFMDLAHKGANFYFTIKPLGYHFFHKKNASSNLSKHLKSLETVIKHHVFNVQEFTKNKKLLWREIKESLNLRNSIFNFKNVSRIQQSKEIMSFLINKPLFTLNYINSLLFKKIKESLIYLFYKLKFFTFTS